MRSGNRAIILCDHSNLVRDGMKIREKTHRADREGRPRIVMAAGTSEQTRHRGLAVDQRGKMRSSARERRAVLGAFVYC